MSHETKPSITARESQLWDQDAHVAERITHWFDVLIGVRKAAGAGVDPRELVEQIKRIDPDRLWSDSLNVMTFMFERFDLTREDIDRRKKAAAAAASKGCPYTQAEYDRAAGIAGTKQEALAFELGVDRKTLRKYGRPSE